MLSAFRAKIILLLSVLFLILLYNWGTPAAIPIAVLFIIACSVYIPSFLGSYWIPTHALAIERVVKEVKARKGRNFYDLGSGDARLIEAVAKGTNSRSTGVEIDPVKWLLSTARIRLKGLKRAKILRANFYKTDLSAADIIFCYLPNRTLEKLEPKIKKLHGKTIICYRIKFPNLKPVKQIKSVKIFIYKV